MGLPARCAAFAPQPLFVGSDAAVLSRCGSSATTFEPVLVAATQRRQVSTSAAVVHKVRFLWRFK